MSDHAIHLTRSSRHLVDEPRLAERLAARLGLFDDIDHRPPLPPLRTRRDAAAAQTRRTA